MDVRERLWPALRASATVWPAAIYINVTFIALPYRVLFVNVVGMGYGMMLSYMANQQPQQSDPDDTRTPRLSRTCSRSEVSA